MPEKEVPVTFKPAGRTVHVLPGTHLVEAAAGAGIVIDLPCGGDGVCGKCRVVVLEGAREPTLVEYAAFSTQEIDEGVRLACQSSVDRPTTVHVPPTSLVASQHKILVQSRATGTAAADPAVRKHYVEMPPPDRRDGDADLLRLEKAVGPLEVDLTLLREMPDRLRRGDFRGTAVVDGGRLIDFEPGNTESESLAVAVDVGTTTLAAELVDLNTAASLAVVSRLNPQNQFGDDVLSRIVHTQKASQGLAELQSAVIDAVDEMIAEAADRANVVCERIYRATFSGNTTMQQLLCGIDPRSLGQVPFVPAVGRGLQLPAADLGLHIHPRATAYVMPVVGGFVGGDAVSGMLATALAESPGPTLLIDVGTNGEIVLFAAGKLAAASTAAGPAFEGARISHGMRGSTGAIEKVVIDGALRVNVIGDVPPVGLCGSALIDLTAELLRYDVLTPEGKLLPAGEIPDSVPDDLRRRLVSHRGRPAFLLVPESESGTDAPVVVTQADFREMQLATGAIRAGIGILLRRAGLAPTDLDGVLIAGAFGNFIRRSNAQRIGLLPPEIPRPRIKFQGNTSLAGARLASISETARRQAEDLARRTEHVDLSLDPDFHEAFAEAMIFPNTGR